MIRAKTFVQVDSVAEQFRPGWWIPGAINIGMTDGHVELLKLKNL
jgi:prepilin-type processing-associated H-X9-DG protein